MVDVALGGLQASKARECVPQPVKLEDDMQIVCRSAGSSIFQSFRDFGSQFRYVVGQCRFHCDGGNEAMALVKFPTENASAGVIVKRPQTLT